MKKPVLLFSCLMLVFINCKSDDPVQTVAQTFTNDEFEFENVNDWKLVNEEGIDSYVGYYFKMSDTIRFDFGPYGFETIDDVKVQPNTFYMEEIEINNCPGKIVGYQIEGNRWWYAYIQNPNGSGMNNVLYIKNPLIKSEIIKVFKSHRFKK